MWTVGDLMTRQPYTVPHDMPVATCLSLMQEKGFRHLPVLDGRGGLKGVATDFDLLGRVRTGGAVDWVGAVARPHTPAAPDTDAMEVLERQLDERREGTVVVNPVGQPLGVFTESDALDLAGKVLKPWKQCGEIMTDSQLHLVHPEGEASACLDFLVEHDIRHLLVIDHNHALTGVISHRDLVGREGRTVGELMANPIYLAHAHTPLEVGVQLMSKNRIGCLPIAGPDKHYLGIVTRTDVLRALLAHMAELD